MPDDSQELCCAAGICCAKPTARRGLADLLRRAVPSLSDLQALALADAINADFDIVPRSLRLGDFLTRFAAVAREYPYT